jgi:hypothetical protein
LFQGTPAFIALEVLSRRRYFDEQESRLREISPDVPRKPVVHNYIHDLESVWWMANYAVFSTVPEKRQWGDELSVDNQRAIFSKIFPLGGSSSIGRQEHFCEPDRFLKNTSEGLAEVAQSTAFALLGPSILMRQYYQSFYRDEGAYYIEDRYLDRLYDVCKNSYRAACRQAPTDVRDIDDEFRHDNSSGENSSEWEEIEVVSAQVSGEKRDVDLVDGENDEPQAKRAA